MDNGKKVLVMYDVRGIQNYIFRTPYVKDAIGASAIIKDLFEKAMQYALKTLKEQGENLTADLKWHDEEGPVTYNDQKDTDFAVLYIGGGNACAVIKNRHLAVRINKAMSRYIIDHTYALQLAVAIIEKGNRYDLDYQRLNAEMVRVKAEMAITSPVGALPVMRTEIRTGYPLISEEGSTESQLKKNIGQIIRRTIPKDERVLDSLTTERGTDSLIAVVHIDGNNMGLRIRSLIQDIESYDKAVTAMRGISYNISKAYSDTFMKMYTLFNGYSGQAEAFRKKEKSDIFLTPILVAGDDITYVCNAKVALASVEYFAKEISYLTMNGGRSDVDKKKYGFSVCGGISYIGSHFPFNIGYEVAEACCSEAKKRAKLEDYMDGDRVGNWVDFQITRNVHARNLKNLRGKEYVTPDGENLLLRPYFIPASAVKEEGRFKTLADSEISFDFFKKAVMYFRQNEKTDEGKNEDGIKAIPRSFVKALRDAYPLGNQEMVPLLSFLRSRGMTLPDGNTDCRYIKLPDREKAALWYDSLEMADDYIDFGELEGGTAS